MVQNVEAILFWVVVGQGILTLSVGVVTTAIFVGIA
jgi:hypothetical protein